MLGPDDPDTLNTRHGIARATAARGDHAAAEAEDRDVLAARLRVLGPDHPDTLTTRHRIAEAMAERGDLAGAEGEFRVGRGRHEEALAEFSAAGRLQSQLAGSHAVASRPAGWTVGTQTRAGRLGEARASLEGLDDGRASSGEVGNARAVICLAEGAPAQGLGDLQGVVDGTARVTPVIGYATVVEAHLLAGLAHRELGDQHAANEAAERALALAEPDRLVLPFAMTGSRELLEAMPRHETAHAALLTDILDVIRGSSPGAGRSVLVAAGGGAQSRRAQGAALSADEPFQAGDRQRTVRLCEHGQHPHPQCLRQARGLGPFLGRAARARATAAFGGPSALTGTSPGPDDAGSPAIPRSWLHGFFSTMSSGRQPCGASASARCSCRVRGYSARRETRPRYGGTEMMSSAVQDRRAAPADRRWLVLLVVAVAQLMVVLDATVVNIALPSAQRALGFSNNDRQWVVTCYALAFGSLLLLGGRIGDMFSRKRVFITGLAGFAVASAIGGASVSFPMLVTARTLQGAFGALLAPAALGTLTSTFTDQRERGRAFAVFGAVASGGAGVGLILGGVLTQYLSWRYTLYVNLIFAAFAIAGALAWIRSSRPATRPRLDWPGTVLASAGLFLIVFGFSRAEIAGWAAPLTVTCLVAGPLLLAAFVAAERRSAHPLLPLRVILDRTRGGSYAVLGLTGIALFGVFLFLTYYLQEVKGYSPVASGLLFLPFVGGILVSSTVSSVALPRVGPRALIASGMLLSTGAMAYLTQLTVTSSYAAVILPAVIVMGLGFGMIFAVTINTATAGVRRQDAGVASALVNTMQQVGGSIGLSALSTVALTATASYLAAHHTGPLAPAIAATRGYTTAFAVAAAILGLGVILAIVLLPSRRRLAELRTGAAEPTPAPEPQPAPQAIPVALCGCSPVINPVSGAAVAAGRGSHPVRS